MLIRLVIIFVVVTTIFATAVVITVRGQLKWEDEQASVVSGEAKRVKRRNYRIVVGVFVGTYLIFLTTVVLTLLALKDANLL